MKTIAKLLASTAVAAVILLVCAFSILWYLDGVAQEEMWRDCNGDGAISPYEPDICRTMHEHASRQD